MYNSYTASVEELVTTRWHQCGTSSRGADCREAERGGGSDRPERAQAASQRPGRTLAGERQHDLHWAFSFVFFSPQSAKRVGQANDGIPSLQRHLARTAGRWKDTHRKNTLSELQDELMSVRLREAEAQADLRETRQRLAEMETQVRAHLSFLTTLYSLLCAAFPDSSFVIMLLLIEN